MFTNITDITPFTTCFYFPDSTLAVPLLLVPFLLIVIFIPVIYITPITVFEPSVKDSSLLSEQQTGELPEQRIFCESASFNYLQWVP